MAQVTKSTRPVSDKEISREWHLIDVAGKHLGREIPRIAELLQGKHKVSYVPYLDMGDNVVVINAEKVTLTGNKENEKEYSYYSGYPGGQKVVSYKQMKAVKPTELVRHAVLGMLPKNKLRARRLTRLFIFAGDVHPYANKFTK